MSKVLKFPETKKEVKHATTITKQFCTDCGGGLDLWLSSDGVAFGICPVCDFDIGTKPIVIMENDE